LKKDKVSTFWPLVEKSLRLAIESGDPPGVPDTPETYTNILKSMLEGYVDCFMIGEVANEAKVVDDFRILAIGTTIVSTDPVSGSRTLLIYTLSSFVVITDETWRWAFSHLMEYAQERGCVSMIAITRNARVLDIINKLGGSTEYRLVELEVDNASS
jgi:hypothetical protein